MNMKLKQKYTYPSAGVLCLGALLLFNACGGNGGMSMGDNEYTVETVTATSSSQTTQYPATIKGMQDIEIRPQVSGFIVKLCVDEGATVRKGQALFQIDPTQYAAAAKQAKANVESAKAALHTAELTAQNKKMLYDKKVISQFDYQTALNSLETAKASLAQAQASLVAAEQNLGFCTVTSPSDGVVGTFPYRVGSLVSASISEPLTTVSEIGDMYVYFSMTEKELLTMTKAGGTMEEQIKKMPAVKLQLADGSMYAHEGRIDAVSGVIDQTTGSVSMRAVFPNKERVLRSGGSGVVLIPEKNNEALVIPQNAVSEIQDKRYVFVVTDSSTVAQTEIQVLSINDGQQFVVTSGLKPGDRIVTEGVGTTVRNNMKITPITPEQAKAKLQGAIQQAAGSAK